MHFWKKTLHFSDSSSAHHQEFNGICHTGLLTAVRKLLWHIPTLCVQWKAPDDGQMNCPKHVEFYSQNKFEKLVHVVGFIIRIYHDAMPTWTWKSCVLSWLYLYSCFNEQFNVQYQHTSIAPWHCDINIMDQLCKLLLLRILSYPKF